MTVEMWALCVLFVFKMSVSELHGTEILAKRLLEGSPLLRSFFSEKSMRDAEVQRLSSSKLCNSRREAGGKTIWQIYHRPPQNSNFNSPPFLHGIRAAGSGVATPCDFNMAKSSKVLGPDSFYQTIMSEHSAIINAGLAVPKLHSSTHDTFVGTCSWKAALKGRPVPCNWLQALNMSNMHHSENILLYWGPKAGPLMSLDQYQATVSPIQPKRKNYIGDTLQIFFQDVFKISPNSNPSTWAKVNAGEPSLPWSNYFVTKPRTWSILAKFDVVAAAWLDMKYPSNVTSELGCPKTYKVLEKKGVLSTLKVEKECSYCRTANWTNWHRCKVGCHRCWSYVMEQMNVVFYAALLNRVYIHDDSECASGGRLLTSFRKVSEEEFGDFSISFIENLYDTMERLYHT
jgi:hypothetical protein